MLLFSLGEEICISTNGTPSSEQAGVVGDHSISYRASSKTPNQLGPELCSSHMFPQWPQTEALVSHPSSGALSLSMWGPPPLPAALQGLWAMRMVPQWIREYCCYRKEERCWDHTDIHTHAFTHTHTFTIHWFIHMIHTQCIHRYTHTIHMFMCMQYTHAHTYMFSIFTLSYTFTYICTHAHFYTTTPSYLHAYMLTHPYTHLHTLAHIPRSPTGTHTCTHIHTHPAHTHMYIYTCTLTHNPLTIIHTLTCTYTYTHAHSHFLTRTHTHTLPHTLWHHPDRCRTL